MKQIDPEVMDETVRRIVDALHPEEVYLYGSHAYGVPHEDSDIDLLVVVGDTPLPSHRRALPAYRALRGLRMPAEIKVVTRAEFRERAGWQSSIEHVVRERGKRLYSYWAAGGFSPTGRPTIRFSSSHSHAG